MNIYQRLLFSAIVLVIIAGCNPKQQTSINEVPDSSPDSLSQMIGDLTSRLVRDSLNGDLYHERSKLLLKQEKVNDALRDITRSIELDSLNPDYYLTLADVHLGRGKVQSALEALDKALSLDSDDVAVLLKAAEIHVVIRDYKKAIGYIDRVLNLDESQPKAYFLRGVVLLENSDTLHAIPNFQKAIDKDQDYFDAHLQLGLVFADKKSRLAVDYLNNALNLQPENKEVQYYLALFYQESGKYDKAIALYEAMLQKNPDFYFGFYNIGYIHLVYLQDYDKAIGYFTNAIEIKPDYTDAWYNRGFAYEMKKDVENSLKDYKKALELTPNYEKAIDGINRVEEFLSKPGNK